MGKAVLYLKDTKNCLDTNQFLKSDDDLTNEKITNSHNSLWLGREESQTDPDKRYFVDLIMGDDDKQIYHNFTSRTFIEYDDYTDLYDIVAGRKYYNPKTRKLETLIV